MCAVGGVCGEEVGKVQGADYYASGDCACNNVHIIYMLIAFVELSMKLSSSHGVQHVG